MIKCQYPENSHLYLLPCPNCNSINVEENGDDIDGTVNCNVCGLCTPVLFGTKSAIHAWNKRLFMHKWEFMDNSFITAREYIIMI